MKKAIDPIKELKRELAALTKKVATLEKQLAKSKADLTCTSLTVVDFEGKPVASIDAQGAVSGRSVTLSKTSGQRSIFLDGNDGGIECRDLTVISSSNNGSQEVVNITSSGGDGVIKLRGAGESPSISFQAVQSQGGVIQVGDKNGVGYISIMASESWADLTLENPLLGQGSVTLDTSYVHDGDGVIWVKNHLGTTTAVIPPQKEGEQPKASKSNPASKKANRKRVK